MSNDFYDNLLRATDQTSNISFEKYATVTFVNDDGSVSCLEVDGELQHDFVPVLNGLIVKLGDKVVLGFVDNSVYNPYVLGVLNGESSTGGVQSDWNESDSSKLSFIKNKPTIPSLINYYNKSETDSLLEDKADSVHIHSINDVTDLTASLNGKVDKVNGKGLSTVDFTDTSYVHTDNNYTTGEKSKLASLENYDDTDVKSDISDLQASKQNTLTAGANISIVGDVISASSSTQIQSDYAQTDSTQVDYIKNKPDIRQLVIDVLNEKFDGMISDAKMENGKLKVNRFDSGDFDD